MSLEEWSLMVGEIVAPFGIKGEAKVRLSTDFPDRFSRLRQVCLRLPDGAMRLWDVESARHHKEQVLLKLKGVNRIEDVDPLRNAQVLIRATEAVRLPANEYYIHDLVGCEVVTAAGRVLGPLTSVLRGDAIAHDVYVVGEGKSEIMLPAVREVVREVDLRNRRIVVTPTPGLLPEEQETGTRESDETEEPDATEPDV